MITIENECVYGWEAAIRGARNPMNSWNMMDSTFETDEGSPVAWIGPNDQKLMRNLANAGSDHGKFLRMITVTMDITAPLYWWKEFDTYKVGTVANSCSTMHKIHAKEFTLEDFSHEHLCDPARRGFLEPTLYALNFYRDLYLDSSRHEEYSMTPKDIWWQMIQLLPTSYNQRRTVLLNYAVLRTMYHARKHHKLDEWRHFCRWVESLPYSELITGGDTDA